MRFAVVLSTLTFSVTSQWAAAASESREFEYPELVVSPSASERLAQEAKAESKNRWSRHWAIQTSSAMTLIAGLSANSDPGKKEAKDGEEAMIKTAAKMATYVGGGWLVATGVMSAVYTPYQSGMASLGSMSQTSKKDKLAYERYAEEAIDAPARIARVMTWASFLSNAVASGLVASQAKNSMTQTLGGIGTLASVMPLLFQHPWASVACYQHDYKKRIYGPLTSASMTLVPHDGAMAAVTSAGIEF